MDSVKSLFNSALVSRKILSLGMFAILLISLPVAVVLLQQQQDKRQQAAEINTIYLNPISDTYVDANSPTSSNSANPLIKVDTGTEEKIAYLKFDLTSLEGKTITDAKLRLMITGGSAGLQSLKDVDDNSWLETITYATKPALSSEFATIKGTTSNTFKTITLTSKINAKKGQIFSFAIDTLHQDTLTFKSREATRDIPRLAVTYTSAATPTPITTTITPTTPPIGGSCESAPVDVVLLFDKSASMSQEIKQAKNAAKLFIDKVALNSENRVSFISFDRNVSTVQFTGDFNSIKTAIDSITSLDYGTCTQCGMNAVNAEIAARGRSNFKKVVVFLTDGRAQRIISGPADTKIAEEAAIQSVKTGFAAHNYTYFTIGLGSGVNTTFLRQIATITGGKYYFSPTVSDLDEVYQSAAAVLGKGSVTGTVYYDIDRNGTKDASESALTGWTINIKEGNGPVLATSITSETGGYDFTGLCEGKTYSINQTVQAGWVQINPPSNGSHTITIVNATSFENKDFGNTKVTRCSDTVDNDENGFADTNDSSCHTDGNPKNPTTYDPAKDGEIGGGNTCTDSKDNNNNNLIDGADPICHTDGSADNPETYDPTLPESGPVYDGMILNLNVFLHGIGSSGDNRNPASDMSNKNPLHPVRKSIVEIFNSTNTLVASSEANITYASASGSFVGTTNFAIPGGNYTIKIKTEQHLKNQYSGILTLSLGDTIDLPPISLVTGDVNNDNRLDILDYNTLYGCYTSDLFPTPRNCAVGNSVKADIDDEGHVNLFDLNLFIRELSVQSGL